MFEAAIRDLRELDWRDFVAKYDGYSLKDYLQLKGVSDSMTDLIGPVLNNEAISDIGFIEFVIDECLFQQDLDQINGGYDLLPRSFLPYLKDDIVFNAQVHSVQYDNSSVSIKYEY